MHIRILDKWIDELRPPLDDCGHKFAGTTDGLWRCQWCGRCAELLTDEGAVLPPMFVFFEATRFI